MVPLQEEGGATRKGSDHPTSKLQPLIPKLPFQVPTILVLLTRLLTFRNLNKIYPLSDASIMPFTLVFITHVTVVIDFLTFISFTRE